jgi:hypothetical protein
MKRTKRSNKRSNTKKRMKRTKRMRRKRSQNKIGGMVDQGSGMRKYPDLGETIVSEKAALSRYYDEQAIVFPQELRSEGVKALQEMDAKRLEAHSYVKEFNWDRVEVKIEWHSWVDRTTASNLRHWVTEPSAYLKLRLQALVGTGLELTPELQQLGNDRLAYQSLATGDKGILREELRRGFVMNGKPISDETTSVLMMLADRTGNGYVTYPEFGDFVYMLYRAEYKKEEFAAELPPPLMNWLRSGLKIATQQLREAEARVVAEKKEKKAKKRVAKTADAMAELEAAMDAMAAEKRSDVAGRKDDDND